MGGLLDAFNSYRQADLASLAKELKLIDRMQSGTDKTLTKPTQDIYDAASPSLEAQTTVDADHDTFVQKIKNALEKSNDPSKVTSVSDAVNTNPGTSVGMVTGSSGDADLVNGAANQAGVAPAATPEGGFSGTAKAISRDLWDSAKQNGQKALNSVSTAITNAPELLVQNAALSCAAFIRSGGDVNAAFNQHTLLVNLINDDAQALGPDYYSQSAFIRTQNARPSLQYADDSLVEIRSRLLGERYFDEGYYADVREYGIKAAADALMAYGTNNRVAEIRGALTALDFAMALLDKLYRAFWNHINNLINYFQGLVTKLLFQGPMLCMLNQVQAEVRSIERSMDAALLARIPSKMSMMERLWWMELLVLYHKMMLTPRNVLTYIAQQSDPGGHVAAYDAVITALTGPRGGLPVNLELLQHQTDQYKYWAQRSLEDDSAYVRTHLNSVRGQIVNDNTATQVQIASAVEAPAVVGYSTRVDTRDAQGLLGLFEEAGMDRAKGLMLSGDWANFFKLTPQNASSSGHFALVLGSVIQGAAARPGMTFESLAKLSDAQRYVANQSRAQSLNGMSFSRHKDEAKAQLVQDDLPEAQTMQANVERYIDENGDETLDEEIEA
ncbi:MAG: hypothetical protein ABFE07_29510 [Armatimonadia bacterium]